jgi:hypothetical protein
MKKRSWLLLCVAMVAAIPAMVWGQGKEFPITVVAPGKGPYTFPAGYQTPWDKIEILVTAKMSPNLFYYMVPKVLIPLTRRPGGGSASGPDGVLMVDSQNSKSQRRH